METEKYIKQSVAVGIASDLYIPWGDYKLYNQGISDYEKVLRDVPVENVAEIVYGEWIYDSRERSNSIFVHPKCSICGNETLETSNFCPNCGAKMIISFPKVDCGWR